MAVRIPGTSADVQYSVIEVISDGRNEMNHVSIIHEFGQINNTTFDPEDKPYYELAGDRHETCETA